MAREGRHTELIKSVAQALGEDLLKEVVFLGGCTTELLVTDEFIRDQVRYTEDVDVVVSVVSYGDYKVLQEKLRERGFQERADRNAPTCAMWLGSRLRVDFLPDSSDILGYSNRWYREVMDKAESYDLDENCTIRLITAPLFLATKLEAFEGRGERDLLGSQDIEDIINLIDGRPGLIEEVRASDFSIKGYLSERIANLLSHPELESLLQSHTGGDNQRMKELYQALQALIQ